MNFFKKTPDINKRKEDVLKVLNFLGSQRRLCLCVSDTDYKFQLLLAGMVESGTNISTEIFRHLKTNTAYRHPLPHSVKITDDVMSGTGLAVNIIQFLAIPFEYLWAWSSNQKLKSSFSVNARWALEGFLLVLAIATVANPVFALPFGLAATMVTAGSGFVMMANTRNKNQELKDKISLLDTQLEEILEAISSKISNLVNSDKKKNIEISTDKKKNIEISTDKNLNLIAKVEDEIKQLDKNISVYRNLLVQKQTVAAQLKQYGVMVYVDESVKIILAAVMVAGITILLATAAPVGALMISGAVAAGFFYSLSRTIPQISAWVKSKMAGQANKNLEEEALSNDQQHLTSYNATLQNILSTPSSVDEETTETATMSEQTFTEQEQINQTPDPDKEQEQTDGSLPNKMG